MTAASSVPTRGPRRRRSVAARRAPRAGARQRGQRARAEPRDAVAGHELGEVAPVRADVGERARGAAELGVDAPVVVLGAAASPAGRCRGAGGSGRWRPPRTRSRASRTGRVVAVDERDGGDLARGRRGVDEPARAPRRARAASRRSRACRRPARPRRAAGAGGWACRCDDVDVVGGHDSSELANARSTRARLRPARRGRPRGRDADDVGAGEARGAAWTAPMKPVARDAGLADWLLHGAERYGDLLHAVKQKFAADSP